MKLEGTLDAFSLPDIFSLLSATRKTGTLHVRRDDGRHGAIHLRDGAITGARTQVDRQELGRRLVGAGLVDDVALEKAVERLAHEPGTGLGRMLADTAPLDAETAREVAGEQAVDAVFDLLRWTDGAFAFDADERDPDDLGASLTVEQVVGEARARLEAWPAVAAVVPSHDAVVLVAAAPAGTPEVDARDWWLLALVDGRRTVGALVALSGRGEHAVVCALAGLVRRGLLQVRDPDDAVLGSLHRRHALLARLEGVPAELSTAAVLAPPPPPVPAPSPPTGSVPSTAVPAAPVPGRRAVRDARLGHVAPPPRSPAPPPRPHPAPQTASGFAPGSGSDLGPGRANVQGSDQGYVRGHDQGVVHSSHQGYVRGSDQGVVHGPDQGFAHGDLHGGAHGGVHGATALQPQAAVVPALPVPSDSGIDTTLLLRLIAGVRGL